MTVADQIVHGLALGVRDVPGQGMQVRVVEVQLGGIMLEPAEAAELGAALIAQAEDAMHASRSNRR